MKFLKKLEFWALVIAGFSLVLSGWTLLYTRTQIALTNAQLVLTKGQIKSYVQVSEAKLVEPLSDARFVQIQLKLKNFGQTAAANVQGDMDYHDYSPDPNGEGNYATLRKFGPMGPGYERTVMLTSNRRNMGNWPVSLRGDRDVYIYGTVWYTDDTTAEDRKEDWCYEFAFKTEDDLKKIPDLKPCDILMYESKKDPRRQ